FIAGVGRMPYMRFLPFSICGCVGWIFFITMLGYVLGNVPLVRAHFEKVIFLIIFVSLLPVLVETWRAHRSH
ncbi:MAG: hypothetical protein ABFD86_12620, partial [Bryobacteraceae bacterium]